MKVKTIIVAASISHSVQFLGKNDPHPHPPQAKLETDPSDLLNEMLVCCRKSGRVAVAGMYIGYTVGATDEITSMTMGCTSAGGLSHFDPIAPYLAAVGMLHTLCTT